ncbi:arginine/serine-rich coiled-coil protein 2 isoform X2 [Amyelois transitella]|uniref:arginine/serine-rich coiled-coil protein 2 isoform X2 n=1 Tax=Amyelois transitella TaxID=680683 RepID=UPI00298FEE1B|nr:arginine/serine-rich coiled-coil protein 2 isoform X2 [Amyelois transitella]
MESLVGYGSDDENDIERYGSHQASVSGASTGRRRDDDTNYDDVNMDLSEDSQAESEPELPPAEPEPKPREERRDDSRPDSRDRPRRSRERRERPRDSPPRHARPDKRPDRRHDPHRSDRKDDRGRPESSSRRGLLGDRPDDRSMENKMPALMDLKPYGAEPPPGLERRSHDARNAVSPRFSERDRPRDRQRDRDGRRERRSEDKSSRHERRSRSRSRGAAFPPPHHVNTSGERRGGSPSGDYRPSSYKVNKKLEVMEKMGLQIKTPDGMMATAQQLRAAAGDAPASALPSYYNPGAVNSNKIMDQVQKRKLLWSNKNKSEAEEAAKWSGTRFAQDNDGKQVSKFMRLMGIKEPNAVKDNPDKSADPIKKQEELFQAMQAQYEVARATTHTMRGVGLGFQRGQF